MGKAFGQVTGSTLTPEEKDRALDYRRYFMGAMDRSEKELQQMYERFYHSSDPEQINTFYRSAVRVASRSYYLEEFVERRPNGLDTNERKEAAYLRKALAAIRSVGADDAELVSKMNRARELVAATERARLERPLDVKKYLRKTAKAKDPANETLTPRNPPPEYDEREQAMTPVSAGSSPYTSVSKAREARIEEYIGQLTGEAKERAEKYWNYYTALYADTSPNWQRVGRDEQYVASMFCPKPDPLGRFILCDITSSQPRGSSVEVWLAGSSKKSGGTWTDAKAIKLGSGYSGGQEDIEGDTFNRSHTPDGVALEGAGLGTVLYSAHALAAYVYSSAAGCYSDSGRSRSASNWWENARDSGFAESATGGTEEDEVNHCESISDSDYSYRGRYGTILDSEVCGSVTVQFGSDEEFDILYARRVVAAGFVAFGALGASDPLFSGPWEYPVGPKHRPFWDALANDVGRTGSPRTNLFIGREGQGNGPYNLGADGKLTVRLTPKRAEMFSRAMHGPSPVLAASILEALAGYEFYDLAAQYATRPDIAPLLASNKRLAELLGQRRLPGLAGMPDKAHARIMGALGQAQRGELRLDLGKQNPLGFKPMSPALRADVAKYGELG